ncbi:PAS domain S-box protein [Sphingomonas jatrophae]|uniref:histidine kinase n=1 Tax=Sphingomonas jatrophae TaxID=1166337 RepID=A0A1I6LCT3_9SPHN|nr:PAS domain S-box protein [Sphingomonas jatrophae]SFS01078.1 PAS domain S-box-containing protein [Sphingomonas jatrophae]
MDDREQQRLAALDRYAVLDTPREESFDELAQLAARLCDAPIAAINLIGDGRLFSKAEVGLGGREAPLESSFCAQAILEQDMLVVPDATQDPRFAGNPLVIGEPHLRFYAGAILRSAEGMPIGTLCILDHQPRQLGDVQQETLRVLARQVMAQLDLRRTLRDRDRRLEEALASETRYRLVLDSARDYAIVILNEQRRIAGWSAGAEMTFGWSEAEAIGRPFEDLFTPEDRAAGVPAEEIARAAVDGCTPDARWHQRADGARVFLNGSTHPLPGPGGGFLKIARNETNERRQAEELATTRAALVDSEARFRNMADHAPVMMWVTDATGSCTYLNRSWYDFTGQTEAEALGYGWLEATHPDDCAEAERAFRTANADHVPFRVEYRLRRADGSYRWAIDAASPRFGANGEYLGYVGSVIDIEDRRAAEERVRTNEEQLRLATDAADVGMWDVDLDNDTLFWPARVKAMFGISPDVPVSMADFYAGLHPQDFDQAAAAFAAAVDPAVRTVYDVEYRTVGKEDGVIRWVAAKGRGVFDDAGVCHRAIGTAIDITERKKIEQALKDLNETLEQRVASEVAQRAEAEEALRQAQKMEAVGQLTGGIAHDFNNMLTGVIGSLDLVQRYIATGRMDRVGRYIEAASTSAQRAASLTARLLAFGRRQSLDLRGVDVNALVAGMEDMLHRTLGEQVALETHLAGDLWAGHTDANQLESALLNLCINARDAMPTGGKLTIETANTRLDEAAVRDHAELAPGDYVVICVSDTGIGMAASTVEKVFEPFFTTKPVGQGTGLGLSMIYGFARQSGGHVRIYSELGQGTTIKLYIPRARNAVAAAPAWQAAAPAGDGETVMVVEDDASVRLIVLDVLGALGYDAIEAVDGRAAVPILQSDRKIDLLISDVGLPGLNGRQLAEIARQHRPGLQVLFITGYAQNAAVRAGFLDAGMEMMTKPFAVDALATKIREMLEGRSVAAASVG